MFLVGKNKAGDIRTIAVVNGDTIDEMIELLKEWRAGSGRQLTLHIVAKKQIPK